METNIGTLIKNNLYDQRISVNELSKRIGISMPTIYTYIRRNDMQVSMLYRISKALSHNFFHDIDPPLPNALPASKALNSPEGNTILLQRIALLEQENSYLKEINKLLIEKGQDKSGNH